MTLEKHIVDTMKEWQMKIGSFDSNIRLYYPKASLCRYLNLEQNISNEELCRLVEQYLTTNAEYLGKVSVSEAQGRYCIMVLQEGCDYVGKKVPAPEFLVGFLEVLRCQNMQRILTYFEKYATEHGIRISVHKEEGGHGGTVVSFDNECVEPYVYCIDENEFGITYHRFTKEEYVEL